MNLTCRVIVCILFLFEFGAALAQDVAQGTVVEYSVKAKDTPSKIALEHGMTLNDFMSLNGLDESAAKYLQLGQKVKVIDKSSEAKIESSVVSLGNSNVKGKESNVGGDYRESSQEEVVGEDSGKVNVAVMIVALLLIFVAIIWRVKYWNKFKIHNQNNIFVIIIIVGILLMLLSLTFLRNILLWLIGIVVVVAIGWFVIKRYNVGRKNNMQNNPLSEDLNVLKKRIKELEREIDSLKSSNARLTQDNSELIKKKNELFEENVELGELIDKLKTGPKSKEPVVEDKIRESSMVNHDMDSACNKYYAESIMDGVLVKVKNVVGDDSIFELLVNGKDVATLTILQSAYQRILTNVAYIDGCDKQIIGNNYVKVTPGKAVCNEQGKWVVAEKPVVIIS